MSPDHTTSPRTVADLGRLARAARLAGQPLTLLPIAVPQAGKVRPEDAHQIQLIQSR